MLLKDKLKSLREEHDLLQRQVASAIGIDNAVYCKIENGERIARVEHVKALAVFYGIDFDYLKKLWLAGKVYDLLSQDEEPNEVLSIVSESLTEYGIKTE
ncbi:helix-turn-helix transcriptional regulator [Bacteroides acidifaciens]|uniref:helix-turn-helix domain-containing protein n=1 Tax=Bacteroides acidifaciens TaxID=85831 RepID=UPI0025A07B0F|nr:helix-turn-helix transcriptional regulator [Bacteroides acidifaciens]